MRGGAGSWILLGALVAWAPSSATGQGFELSVVVDGRPAPEYFFGGRVYVEARKGRQFALRLTNPSAGRVAVALSVDGRNVIDAKRTSASRAAKWVLGPGESVEIPGWQISGEAARRFFFTETSRSYAKWLGDTSNTGVIEAVFFRELHRPAARISPSELQGRLERRAEPRAEAPPAGEAAGGSADAPAADAEGRRKSLAPARPVDELAATGIGERTDFRVRSVDFEQDPVPAARVRIRYEFRSELVRLGVLPRDGGGSRRDLSRGFEPDYAPDPYRTDPAER